MAVKTAAKAAPKSTAKKKGLGKGLGNLIAPIEEEVVAKSEGSKTIVPITKVEPNREQPRKTFNEESINELAQSIKEVGIFQPLLVQDCKDHYEIIAGERRWRAARVAGLKEIPVIIENLSKEERMEISLIENIQREDLNAIEEANAYRELMDTLNLTQEKLALKVGKNRATIANSMRLLNLSDEIQQMLVDKSLTSGHARALLTIEDNELQLKIAKRVAEENLTVRDIEKLVKEMNDPNYGKAPSKKATPERLKIIFKEMEDNLCAALGTRVRISSKDERNESGKIEIEYYSSDEFDILTNMLLHANDDPEK